MWISTDAERWKDAENDHCFSKSGCFKLLQQIKKNEAFVRDSRRIPDDDSCPAGVRWGTVFPRSRRFAHWSRWQTFNKFNLWWKGTGLSLFLLISRCYAYDKTFISSRTFLKYYLKLKPAQTGKKGTITILHCIKHKWPRIMLWVWLEERVGCIGSFNMGFTSRSKHNHEQGRI